MSAFHGWKKSLAVVALALLAQGCAPGSRRTGPPIPAREGTLTFEEVDGLRVITLRGPPSVQGAAQGRFFKREVQELTRRYVEEFLVRLFGGRELAFAYARAVEPGIPDEMRLEMHALADAAGVNYETIVLFNVYGDALVSGCTTIVIAADRSSGGVVRLGRNVDMPMPPEMQPPAFLAIVHPERGSPYASYTWPGLVGLHTAINAYGLAVSLNGSATTASSRDCIPLGFAMRLALQNSRSARDFVSQMEKLHHCAGWVVTAADATEGISLEISATRLEPLLPEDGVIALTNHYLSESMQALQKGEVAESRDRLGLIRTALARPAGARIGLADLEGVLMQEGVLQPFTLLSAVIEPTAGRLWLWERGAPRGTYREVSVRERLQRYAP